MAMIPAWGIALMVSGGGMGLQLLFAPRVKQTPVDKGKFDDVRIQGSDYGAFIPRVRGKARFGGNLIFSDGIEHTIINSPSDGGKGGPSSPSERTHVYKSSMGVLLSRGEISRVIRMWADLKLIIGNTGTATTGFFEAEDETLTGGAAGYVDATASGGEAVNGLGSGGKVVFDISSVPTPIMPAPDPDEDLFAKTRLSFFYKCSSDKIATIDTDVISPQTINLPSTGGDWSVHTVITDLFADAVSYEYAGAATADIDKLEVEKFWERVPIYPRPLYQISGVVNPDIVYPPDVNDPSQYYNYDPEEAKDGGTGIYSFGTSVPGEAIRFYTGTETQTADAAIIAWLDGRYGTGQGVLRASAMRGLAYVMFEDYTIEQGRPPNFTVELDAGDPDLNDILADLFADVDLETSDYDVTDTVGLTQTGWIEHTQSSRKALIEQLERYHQFRIGEIDGKIRTIVDNGDSIASFDADDLRAHSDGDEFPRYDVEVILKEEHLLPREVRVSIMNEDAEYHNETATAQVFASTVSTESKEYTFPIIDTLQNARTAAEKLLLKEFAENTAYEFWTMPEYAKYSIGDVITVPVNGVDCLMRIEKKQSTLPIGKIRFQCISTGYIYTDVEFQDDTTTSAPRSAVQFAGNTFPRNTVIFVIQSAPITVKDKGRLGVYLAISGRGRGNWGNAGLYREMDADNYILKDIVDSPSPLGIVATGFSTGGGANLDVLFFDDVEFETVDALDLIRNPTVNLIRVDDEWIQFEEATPQTLPDNSPYRCKWRFTILTRGLFGTTDNSHAADEYAAVVTRALRFMDLGTEDIGETINLKAVTGGQNIEVAPVASFTFAPVSAYTITNATTDRTFDADATSINELADVVATIVDDLNL